MDENTRAARKILLRKGLEIQTFLTEAGLSEDQVSHTMDLICDIFQTIETILEVARQEDEEK